MIKEIEFTVNNVDKVLSGLTFEELASEYPSDSFGKGIKTYIVLNILASHFGYHSGQINYYRRILDNS